MITFVMKEPNEETSHAKKDDNTDGNENGPDLESIV